MERHLKCERIRQVVSLPWLSELIPMPRNGVSYIGHICVCDIVDPVQWTIWTACMLNWVDDMEIATVLNWMDYTLLRQLKYWLQLTLSVKSVNLLKQQPMSFCSFPFGIAHHSAKSSRVFIPGHMICLILIIGALVRGILWTRRCVAMLTFSSWYWNTSSQAFIRYSGRRPHNK
jgi:hypothetical protein